MTIFVCDKCSKQFDRKLNYNRHINRKTDCATKIKYGSKTNKKINHKCNHCKKIFSRKDSLTRHLRICKKKINIKGNNNIIGNNNRVAINSTNCNNTYIINLVIPSDFAKDGIANISAEELTKMLKSNQCLWESIIECVNFNPNKPQHHNVYYPDLSHPYGIIYENKKWVSKKIYEIMNRLLDAKVEDLNKILNGMDDCLNKKSKEKIKEALKNADRTNPKCRQKLITYLRPILYNNKDMIIKTKKLIKRQDQEYADILKKGKTFTDFEKCHIKAIAR